MICEKCRSLLPTLETVSRCLGKETCRRCCCISCYVCFCGLKSMFGFASLSKSKRLFLGIVVLLLVDVIWVASKELTEYIFQQNNYDKPYFSTYLKTSMLVVYLTGFFLWRSWWIQCRKQPGLLDILEGDAQVENEKILSEPIFVPVKVDDRSSGNESSDDATNRGPSRAVRFNNLSEVRQLPDSQAEDAVLARLSYNAYVRAEEQRMRSLSKLTVRQVAKLGIMFGILFFFAKLSCQEALSDTEVGVVHILSSTCGLFILVLAAIFPSSTGDRFTLSKLVAVLLSIAGVVFVSLADKALETGIPLGALWSLAGAGIYALYLVLLRRRVENEDKLNMPMFFGFVGVFVVLLMWPGVLVIHLTKVEQFEWPTKLQWLFLIINGLVGTVMSELLWLWGCFLTTSLVAALSLSLIIPMTMLANVCLKNVTYNWMFYAGLGPVFIAFFAVCILSHYENWDPVYLALKKFFQCIFRRRFIPRLRDLDREQTESLIGINST